MAFDGLDGFKFPLLNSAVDDAFAPLSDPPPHPQTSRRHGSRAWIAVVLVATVLLAPVGLRWFATAPTENAPTAPSAPAAEADRDRPLALPQQNSPAGREGLAVTPSQAAPQLETADAPPRAVPPLDVPPPGGGAVPTQPAPGFQAAAPPVALPTVPTVPSIPTAPKTREIRETISPPSANCTSNMAALGFCTLPPASAKE